MTNEILLKIKEKCECLKSSINRNRVSFDDLNEDEKEVYNYIWDNILKSFDCNACVERYSTVMEGNSCSYPYSHEKLKKFFQQDGFDIEEEMIGENYVVKYSISRESIINFSKTLEASEVVLQKKE